MVKPNKEGVEEDRDNLDEAIHLESPEGLHWITLKQLDHTQEELADLHQECQIICTQITQGENSSTNFTRAKNLAPFPNQQLTVLGIPSLFEFISNIKEIQESQGIFAQ